MCSSISLESDMLKVVESLDSYDRRYFSILVSTFQWNFMEESVYRDHYSQVLKNQI